jgi:hypothetical protein
MVLPRYSMMSSRLSVFFVFAVMACGPKETLPPTNDGGTLTNDAGETCNGVCLPVRPVSWDGPYLLWKGNEADAPHCSDLPGKLDEVYTGHGYPDGTTLCGACTCASSIGSCDLPATLITAAASCADISPSVAHLSFDPPTDWTGTCTTEKAIPAGKLCGGVPCVQSVTIAPLTMTQGGCLPIEPPSLKPPPPWKTFARACATGGGQACTATPGVCKPAAPGPDFKQCIAIIGESGLSECPPKYPDRNVFYQGDTPSCSSCACDMPIGSGCSGSIVVSAGSACSPPLLPAISLNEKDATCTDLPPGSALGSKSASDPQYSPGHCEPSGGKPLGTVFCCQP